MTMKTKMLAELKNKKWPDISKILHYVTGANINEIAMTTKLRLKLPRAN